MQSVFSTFLLWATIGAAFPVVLLLGTSWAIGEGEVAFRAIVTYSTLPAISFSVLAGFYSDLIVEEDSRPKRSRLNMTGLFGVFLMLMLVFAAVFDAQDNDGNFRYYLWLVGQACFTMVLLYLCALAKDEMASAGKTPPR